MAMHTLPSSERSNLDLLHGNMRATDHKGWKIIGLTQRKKRRSWLNLNETITHCNTHYNVHRILCVEVNVETIAETVSYNSSSDILGSDYTQLLMHRSLDILIGIHGAQLTQAVLLPPNATVVEILPWAPTPKQNFFGTGRGVWGSWTQTRHTPTPLGAIYHNTDLNHFGYALGRDSVPLCQNVSNTVMHNFSNEEKVEDRSKNQTELEYCLLSKRSFIWDVRNFNVEIVMIDRYINTFVLPQSRITIPLCDDLRRDGERNNFVLYNVWCRKYDNSSVSLQHYYQVGG